MNIAIKDKRYNTVILKKVVLRPLSKNEQTLRILLSYYLNLGCEKYPKTADFDILLGKQYDLGYTVSVNNVGKTSLLTYQLTGVNPTLINDPSYTEQLLIDTFDIATKPAIIDNGFVDDLFDRAKESYLTNLYYNIDNNNQILAIYKAMSIFFENTPRDFNIDGDIEELKKITKDELYQYYLKTVNDEEITYFVGNINSSGDSLQHVKPKIDNFFRERPKKSFKYIREDVKTKQCYLEIIYDLQIFPDNSLFYATAMLNYHFGGGSNSILFRKIREEYGLCYSINSNYYGGSGIILVNAIIDRKNEEKVLELIDEAYSELTNSFNLTDTKKHFKLTNKAKKENLSSLINDHLMDNYFPEMIPSYCDNKEINKTNLASIDECYKKMKKKLVLSYGG